ncbi:copper resistance CopC family protein [Methylococcus sp. Mc7]|uniref:copper resistance CopC family protein n=1 Tax=Methylococcus sp. Mc7 TaxID=2860258 RepID=UPI001C530D40|nr:copper resistance CopC family protein [Methylococcus sp. Mc7]QXP83665.1 copper resistance protein CopC [Methylococcus sp. Mc7]
MRKPIPSLAAILAGLALADAAGAANAAEDGALAAANPFLARTVDTPVHLAHAILVKAIPDRDATVTDVPEEVLLTFNEGVGNDFLALAVVDGEGKRVDNHDARLDFTDRSKLRTSVSKLNPGRYMVRYRVLSADGHVVSGKYFFQVQNP